MIDLTVTEFIKNDAIIFSYHSRVRMFERGISTDDVINFIIYGEIIEIYPDDDPCPSHLVLGYKGEVAYHTVYAVCEDHIRIITVYMPEPDKWINNQKRRR